MNDRQYPDHSADDRQIDRLVDGELAESEVRELLSRLDGDPHGWRRCAVAFLEAQAWRRELRLAADEPAAGVMTTPGMAGRHTLGGRRASGMQKIAIVAVGLLIAFGTGWFMRGPNPGSGESLSQNHPETEHRRPDQPLRRTSPHLCPPRVISRRYP